MLNKTNTMLKATFGVVTSTVDACADPEALTDDAAGTAPVRREAPGLPLECATGASVWGCGVSWATALRGDKTENQVSFSLVT
jgi:hypothetical protein